MTTLDTTTTAAQPLLNKLQWRYAAKKMNPARAVPQEKVERILEAVHGVLERTPPELVADISNNGIVMTGGGSLVDGFDKLITARTGIHTVVAENAIRCVAIGTGKSLDSVHEMNDGTVNLSRRKQMN